ncbi:hypothetical protein BN59_03360 [Legionella massiliensis]|uniref:Coiled-coil-containing protein n=1 Tax=Legionella massiliensis TaxID=1034943 RepID=A0A078L4P7_9GAMM|nr:hypothetical protein [Legionella massiliensis]CDZ79044.1 hypothetical protein BN59_03360 [Legionella massiliensis]CEE14782.1 hypothetical protein BN1094_03360 [Legionella massiliensis]
MAQNNLFNFIATNFASLKAIFLAQDINLKEDENLQGKSYYRFDLPFQHLTLSTEEQAYRLKGHHISIYQTENGANPALSQYHYTAYFNDKAGNSYQLHVYFNAEDKLTMQPLLSIRDSQSGRFTPISSEDFDEQFISLAVSSMRPTIGLLRKQLSDKVSSLKTSFQQFEANARQLSETLDSNPNLYIKALTKVENALALLIPLVPHSDYESRKSFIGQMRVNVQRLYCDDTKVDEPSKGKEKEKVKLRKVQPQTTKLSQNHHTLFRSSRKADTLFVQELDALILSLSQLPEVADQPAHLKQIFPRVYQLALLLELEAEQPSADCLRKLKKLHSALHSEGENLLLSLLKERKFEQARELSPFFYIFDIKNLNLALQSRNHELLDFLLATNNFMINTQPVIIKGVTYPSAVHYCFNRHSQNTPMQDCLAVLIKHGASLLVKGDNGLPIGHTILTTPEHPLKRALESNKDNLSFYKQLIVELNRYLKETEVEEAQQHELNQSIRYYQHCVERLNALNQVTKSRTEKNFLLDKFSSLRSKYSEGPVHNLINKLENDKEFLEVSNTLTRETLAVIKRLPAFQRKQQIEAINKSYDEFDIYFSNNDQTDQDFEELKNSVLPQARAALETIRKFDEYLDITKELKKPTYTKGAVNKANHLIAKQKQLHKELIETHFQYCLPELPVSLKTLENNLHDISASMQSFSDLLGSLFPEQMEVTENEEDEKSSEQASQVEDEKAVETLKNLIQSLDSFNIFSKQQPKKSDDEPKPGFYKSAPQ